MILLIVALSSCARMSSPRVAPVASSAGDPGKPIEHGRLISSQGDVIEFECQVSGDVTDAATFFFIIPPEGDVTVTLLDAGAAPGAPSATPQPANVIEKLLEFKPGGYMRGWRLGTLTVNKRQRGAVLQGLVRLRVELRFETGYDAPPALAEAARAVMKQPRGFGQILHTLVENPADAVRLVAPPPAHQSGEGSAAPKWLYTDKPEAAEAWLKIPIQTSGVFAIAPETLRAAGLRPENYRLEFFRLFDQGVEIPLIELARRGDRLDGPNRLVFSGEPPASPYTATSVYWLAYTPGERGLRAAPLDEPPAGASLAPLRSFEDRYRWEEELDLQVRRGNFLSIEEIRWVGPSIAPGQPATHDFDLPGFDSALQSEIKVEVRFYINRGVIPPPRSFQLSLNGGEPARFTLSAPGRDSVSLVMPASDLMERGNSLRLELDEGDASAAPLRPGALFLDSLEISYRRRPAAEQGRLNLNFPGVSAAEADHAATPTTRLNTAPVWHEVSPTGFTDFPVLIISTPDPAHPRARVALKAADLPMALPVDSRAQVRMLSLSRVDTITSVDRPVNEGLERFLPDCDYLVISHHAFIEGVEPLAAHHREHNGLRTAVVDVQGIYDEFNFGMESPYAIKQFLRHLAETRGVAAPAYVLLVGDCTSDYKNYARNEVTNFVPSFSYKIGTSGNEVWASDHWFTTVLGDDALGEFILSRISVNNRQDLDHIVAKTLHYQADPVREPWRISLTSVADDGEFDNESETLRREHTPPEYLTNAIYLEDLPWVDNYYLPQDIVEEKKAKVSTDGTARIINAFNSGTLYMSFFGHGSPNIWSDERLWFGGDSPNSDNLHLTNFDRATFVANLTCNSGAIDYPIPRWNITITEDMMRMKEGGAIGVFAPSGPGFSSAHQALAGALHQGLFYRGVRGAGEAVARARLQYALSQRSPDLVRMFIQMGDPALELQTPMGRAAFDPPALDLVSAPAGEIRMTATPGFDKGRAWFYLTDESGGVVASWPGVDFSGGSAAVSIVLPRESLHAEWRLSGYFAEDGGGRDSAGSALIRVYRPWVTIEDFRMHDESSGDGAASPRKMTAAIKNQTPLPISDLRLTLETQAPDGGSWREAQSRDVKLTGHELREVEWPADELDSGAAVWRVRLVNHADPPSPVMAPRREQMLLAVQSLSEATPEDDSRLIALPDALWRAEPRNATGAQINTTIDCVAANLHPADSAELLIRLKAGGKVLAESARVVIAPAGQHRYRLSVAHDPGAWPEELSAELEGTWHRSTVAADSPSTRPIRLSASCPLGVPALPDVVVAGIELSPNSPTEGETVFIDARVINTGSAPARDMVIKAFDAPPGDGGVELENMTANAAPVRIEYLHPGGETPVRLRWDPFKNLEATQVVVVADPNSMSPDANRGNNSAAAPLRVRSKAKLQGRGIYLIPPTEEERRLGRVRIEAAVENTGESEAVGVVVAMFKTPDHTPDDQIAEVIIPRIAPGEVETATATWQLTQDDLTADLNPSFLMFFKGSLQRTAGVAARESAPE